MKGLQVSVPKTDAVFAKITYTLVPADREMTVQDLLRHTSGLAYGEITQNAPVKEAYAKGGVYKTGIDYDARDLAPAEEVEHVVKAPLAHQPGTVWEYSLASDMLGRVVESASGMRLAEFLDERLFKPLAMNDSGFWVLATSWAGSPSRWQWMRQAEANKLIDVSAVPNNDSGGAGGVSTPTDYLRFAQMLLNGGQLDGKRVLNRTTIALMTSDHLGTRIEAPITPGELLLGTPGYTFGLGFAVRQGPGVAGVPGSPGEFMWAGYAGTYFWVDPNRSSASTWSDPRLHRKLFCCSSTPQSRLRLIASAAFPVFSGSSSGEDTLNCGLASDRRPRAIGECFDISGQATLRLQPWRRRMKRRNFFVSCFGADSPSRCSSDLDVGAAPEMDWYWTASPQPVRGCRLSGAVKVPRNLWNQTIRQIAAVSIGGKRVRVVVSNEYGTMPLRVGAAQIALADKGSAIVDGSGKALTFGGRASVVIPPGAPAVSDPVDLSVAPLGSVAVSLFLPDVTPVATFHWDARQTTYVVAGNKVSANDFKADYGYIRIFRSGILVDRPPTGAIVTFGTRSLTAMLDGRRQPSLA